MIQKEIVFKKKRNKMMKINFKINKEMDFEVVVAVEVKFVKIIGLLEEIIKAALDLILINNIQIDCNYNRIIEVEAMQHKMHINNTHKIICKLKVVTKDIIEEITTLNFQEII